MGNFFFSYDSRRCVPTGYEREFSSGRSFFLSSKNQFLGERGLELPNRGVVVRKKNWCTSIVAQRLEKKLRNHLREKKKRGAPVPIVALVS